MTFVQGKYKVYNLCSERLYDASLFEGKVGDGTSLDLCPLGWYYCGLQVSRKLLETIGIGVWFLSPTILDVVFPAGPSPVCMMGCPLYAFEPCICNAFALHSRKENRTMSVAVFKLCFVIMAGCLFSL